MFLFGDIIIINFPFSEGQGSKRRPAMVLKDTNDGDLLVSKITSQLYNTSFDISLQGWQQANLTAPSIIRIHKIQTIHSRLLFGQIGKLTADDLITVKKGFLELLKNF